MSAPVTQKCDGEPCGDVVAAFAQQLGILPDEEADFAWLAEVGFQSPLPPRWTSHADGETGLVYYVDHDRQASSWENPLLPYLRRIVEIGRAYLQRRSEDFFEEQKGILWLQHKHDLDCWHGPFADPEGRQYFVNSATDVSSWQDPRIEAQYIFELESSLLTSLQAVLQPPEPDTLGLGQGERMASTPWHTTSGAEVLTLDDAGGVAADARDPTPGGSGGPSVGGGVGKRPKTAAKLSSTLSSLARPNRDEHRSTLEKMSNTAVWVHAMQQDEVEVQRLQFNRKVEDRRLRRQQRQSGGNTRDKSGSSARAGAGCRPWPPHDVSLSSEPLGPMPVSPHVEIPPSPSAARDGLGSNVDAAMERKPSFGPPASAPPLPVWDPSACAVEAMSRAAADTSPLLPSKPSRPTPLAELEHEMADWVVTAGGDEPPKPASPSTPPPIPPLPNRVQTPPALSFEGASGSRGSIKLAPLARPVPLEQMPAAAAGTLPTSPTAEGPLLRHLHRDRGRPTSPAGGIGTPLIS